jgi:hypothetical protein
MKRFGYVISMAAVALGVALTPAALAAGHGGGGFGGHVGGVGGHVGGFRGNVGGFGGRIGGFGGEHTLGAEHAFAGHAFDGRHPADGRGFAAAGHDLGDGIALDGRNVGGNHLMYGRVPRFGRGGVFLGYYYPNPSVCYQYPGYYNPAAGCYGMYPIG